MWSRIVAWFQKMNAAAFMLFLAMALMLILNVFAFLLPRFTEDATFHEVLDGSTRPVVTDRVDGFDGAAVRLGDPINIQATRCNNWDTSIDINFIYFWHLANDNEGVRIPALSGRLGRPTGCALAETKFAMPASVVEYTQRKLETGADKVMWRLEGIETPIPPDGDVGPVRYWETAAFAVVPNSED